jgi:RNA-directed DNA polymerase
MEWKTIDWKRIDKEVSSLQRRIDRASQRDDISSVIALQTLLLESWSAKLKAVRRVTQENRGKDTPGIDNIKSVPQKERIALAQNLEIDGKSELIRRVYIPKARGSKEKRPLGIPTIRDRAKQALVLMALEPQWEARFEPNSYGFRPGRSAHDAIEAIFTALAKKNKYVLDGDIRKWFDTIDHNHLLNKLDTSSGIKAQVRSWLTAGIMEGENLYPSTEGTPQGGVISPLLANIALHGMEILLKNFASKRRVGTLGRLAKMQQLTVVRYADDFVIIHPEKEVIHKCHELLSEWLSPIGLELHPDKTRIIQPLSKENPKFEFLGFELKQRFIGKYRVKKSKLSLPFLTHLAPSVQSIRRHKENLRECFKQQNPRSLLSLLNPKTRGWAQYFRTGVSAKIFGDIDAWLYRKFMRWAEKKHPKRGKRWLVDKYFRAVDPQKWIFGVKVEGTKGPKTISQRFHRETNIERHVKVQGSRSPYDGDWTYWSLRMTRYGQSTLSPNRLFLLKRQKGKCALCGSYFFPSDGTQIDHIIPRKDGGSDRYSNLQLLHIHCHQNKSRGKGGGEAELRRRRESSRTPSVPPFLTLLKGNPELEETEEVDVI